MSAQDNLALMRRFVEFINTAEPKAANELIAPNAVFHVPGQVAPLQGPGGYLAIIGMMRSGFPDIQWTLDDAVTEDDRIAARYTMRGTHRGAFLGVPPTGRPIAVQSMAFYTVHGGQFVEEHGLPDMLGLMQQIGAGAGA